VLKVTKNKIILIIVNYEYLDGGIDMNEETEGFCFRHLKFHETDKLHKLKELIWKSL